MKPQTFSNNFVNYEEMRYANSQGELLQRLSDERITGSTFEAQANALQYSLRQKNMEKILQKFVTHPRQILEVGAGLLDSNGRSFCTKSLPENEASHVIYCDSNPRLAEESPELICLDMKELSKAYPPHGFSHVLSCNALDTLNLDDLEAALTEIKVILQPKGSLVHCLNFEPYIFAFYNDIFLHNTVAIPFINELDAHQALIINQTNYPSHPLLTAANALNPLEKEKFWLGILALDKGGALKSIAESYLPYGKVIGAYEHHIESLNKILSKLGFSSITNELITSEQTIPVPSNSPLAGLKIECSPKGVLQLPIQQPETAIIIIHTHVTSAMNR